MCADVTAAAGFVESLYTRLHRSYITEDALLWQIRYDLAKHIQCVLQRNGIDNQFGSKVANFFKRCKSLRVVHETQSLGIYVIYGRFVFEAEQVHEKRTHFSGTENEYFHFAKAFYLFRMSIC